MSVSALFLKHIDYETDQIFNLWHDYKFVGILRGYADFFLNEDMVGYIEISIDGWEALKEENDLTGCERIVKKIDELFKREDQDCPGKIVRFYCD